MPHGTPNYLGATGTGGDVIRIGHEEFVKIFNCTASSTSPVGGATLTNGDVYWLSWAKDGDSLSPSARPTLQQMATTAIYRSIVVVNNSLYNNVSGIAKGTWGYVQRMGYCPDINTNVTSVAIDRYLQGLNAAATAADDGTAYTTDSFAITVGAIFNTSHIDGVIFGERTLIG